MSKPPFTFTDPFSELPIDHENASSSNHKLFTNIRRIGGLFLTNQIGMTATGVLAQPIITVGLRLSAKKGIEGQTYKGAFGCLASLKSEFVSMTTFGFLRRTTSAIPVASAIMAGGDHMNIDPFSRSLLSAAVETGLAYKTDPEETFRLVNIGLDQEKIGRRREVAIANRPASMSLLFTRNFLYAMAIYGIDPISAVLFQEYGKFLSDKTGMKDDQIKKVMQHSLRLACCASTTPLHNLYSAFASGKYSSIPHEMFEPKNLFKGGVARVAALMAATTSISKGKELAGGISNLFDGLSFFEKRAISDIAAIRQINEPPVFELEKKVEEEVPGAAERSESLVRELSVAINAAQPSNTVSSVTATPTVREGDLRQAP
ncbi:MAG: hypothetical protein A2887_01260 [Alphaproteobacteria bacterium RIFCSPLOWO2_01_FULL_40_26]|nr:MAG: hypothetical protein A3D15_00570 [Alphaproteobacteria bacterium RIFCSPHIGHO2_02_FULL_40_34]OFW87720.1 MAG: hypothetical protein A2794_01110 [Alphaproteobacteria bacterium RIFCSPHIGHO2_01_FULL_40_8]OFW94024.1 MAG: hypothetical protein A2887_01260 [Alphaproteobacteria bacterium RIFCSPLOWO2_01_FULL_40_26]OFX09559.1 MAG: hypothetical protein A3H30_05750 [Alphaproteobacteria bacterium RIFCSPLOWO2_02_FULL_40_19]OFX12015.1 MAG: hypothetical protein A3G22_05665 [Alphaproteobacteria bacterium RI